MIYVERFQIESKFCNDVNQELKLAMRWSTFRTTPIELELELFVRLLSLAICTISGSIYPWYLEGLFLMEGKFPPLSDTSDDDVVVTVNFFG